MKNYLLTITAAIVAVFLVGCSDNSSDSPAEGTQTVSLKVDGMT
ncbi:MAG: hypothetical protein P1V20_03660 [Verrucomicrobiales bacterium]|nr:hypothetical protein [Verrucomicrobiales bacterium]